jgi:LysR family nod box-dependent transcriptional activator
MRLYNLDLNLLVVLDMLLTERSVSQTAQQMRLTQPAISNALARLRQHFQDDLLVQVGRRMVPTPFAESLAEPVHAALEELRRIATTRGEFDPASAERTFTIICSDFVFQMFLTHAIRELVREAPGIKLNCFLTNEYTAELLNQGKADFAIVPDARQCPDHPGVPLFSERFSCIVWKDNPLVGATLTREKYLELEHVSTCLGPSNPPHVEQASLDAHGLVRKIAVYAPNFTSVGEAVVGTHFIATVHARTAAVYAKRLPLRVLAPPVEIAPFVELVQWHKNKGSDPGVLWMRDFLVGCASKL